MSMSDIEFLQRADWIISQTRDCCRLLLELVDLRGENIAFEAVREKYPNRTDALQKKMLLCAHGATDCQILVLAFKIDEADRGLPVNVD